MGIGRNWSQIIGVQAKCIQWHWRYIGIRRLFPSKLLFRQSSMACLHSSCQQQRPSNQLKMRPFIQCFSTASSSNLFTMKIDTPEFKTLFTPELKKLVSIFEKHNYDLRIAGGAVRDLLLGQVPHDVDFATTATPDEMKTMFKDEEIRMINMRGESHGTITCRINDNENFEVTTLRIDVVTDGRHAKVEFTKDWELDALRRDLTINSMFLGLDGTLYDYFGGKKDLENKHICFVGDATSRIQEDYLRILRYFRFFGRIVTNPDGHNEETVEAIKHNINGLEGISGERIWIELKKILSGNHVGSLMKTMAECGMAPYVGLPDKPNIEEFMRIYERSQDLNPLPLTLLPALLDNENEVQQLHKRLKMSRDEFTLGMFIVNHRDKDFGSDLLHYCQDLLCDLKGKDGKPREKIVELLKYMNQREIIPEFEGWQLPRFPVSGLKLLELGVERGPELAATLEALRQKWKHSRYTYTQDQLLQLVDKLELELEMDEGGDDHDNG